MRKIKTTILSVMIAATFFAQKPTTKVLPSIPKKDKGTTLPVKKAESASEKKTKTTLVPKTDVPAQPAIQGIPKRGFAIDWISPKSSTISKIPTFSKIELGVHFPDSLNWQINAFVNNADEKNSINPFNPEEIEVYAELEHFESFKWSKTGRAYGFYYQEFNRVTTSEKLSEWRWDKLPTDDHFRIRFAANQTGKWRLTVIVNLKGKEIARMGEFEFNCTPSKNKGFVKVAPDKSHLALGNESFIPVGQNLPKPSCYLEKDGEGKIINDPHQCADCPCAGTEDWCAHLKNLPMHPKAYLAYHDELNRLKKSGANYFRMINFPFTYEIEYEKLGNYSDRMNCAWELDKMLEKAEKMDLKVNFNLFIGYPLLKAPYGVKLWDWYADGGDDKGYCYRNELGLLEPVEFLTNPAAKKHFKNRIRYYLARYGYSTSIAIFELMSEINGKFPNHPVEVYKWQEEMLNYIKNELNYSGQLFAVNYDGAGPNEAKGDLSYGIKNLDVLGHNMHRTGFYRNDLSAVVEKYKKYGKPLLFGEIGTGDSGVEQCDNQTEWLKDLWMTLFSGSASTGINWNLQHDYKAWENFKHLKNFLYGVDLAAFQKNMSASRKDKLVEVMLLSDTSQNRAFGVIQNVSWNFYTQSSSGKCKDLTPPNGDLKTLQEVTSLSKKKGLALYLNPGKEYQLQWYNPLTGKNLDTVQVVTDSKGKIDLMHPTLTKEMPLVAFKIYTKDVPFSRTPMKANLKPAEGPIKPKNIREIKPLEIHDK